MKPSKAIFVIYAAGFLRSLGVGLLGVVLGVYLARIGFSATAIGLVLATGLIGISIATVLVSGFGDRFGRRRTLLVLTALTGLG